MKYLIIKKVSNVFTFTESSNGTLEDGVIYGGNNLAISGYNNEVYIDSYGNKNSYLIADVKYKNVTYATFTLLFSELVTDGFTGNFKSASGGSGAGSNGGVWSEPYYQSVYTNSYSRPADWLDITTAYPLVQGDQKFVGLHSVYNNAANFVAVLATTSTGSYRVNWGDGTTSDHASNTTAYKVLTYANHSGTDSSRGYRQSIVTIVPLTGNLTSINLYQKHNQGSLTSGYSTGWLDIRMAGASIASLIIGNVGTNVFQRDLEQFDFIGTNAITSFQETFFACSGLRKIVSLNTALSTSMGSMFNGCSSLITIPLLNTSSVTNMGGLFLNCSSLITLPLLNTSAATSFPSAFNGCKSLTAIPLLNTANVTIMASMFSGCTSLMTIPLLSTGSVTTMASMFNGCTALMAIPMLNTAKVTTMTSMFSGCISLITIPLLNTALVTDLTFFLSGCTSVQTIPLINTSAVNVLTSVFQNCSSLQTIPLLVLIAANNATDFTNIFLNCNSLSKGTFSIIKNNISYLNAKLGRLEIVDIFNTLETQIGKTINISGNWGAPLLTAGDRLIATNKGWVITG